MCILLASQWTSIGLGVGYYGVWFITGSFVMDASRWHEAGVASSHPPAHRALGHGEGSSTALTQVLFTGCCLLWLLNCSCHNPTCNSKLLVGSPAFGRTGAFPDPWNTSGCWLHASGFSLQKPQDSSGHRFCVWFLLLLCFGLLLLFGLLGGFLVCGLLFGLGFFNSHFSCSYPLLNLGLVQRMRLTPTFLKNTIYLLFELHTQVSYKWRVTAICKNKGVCWAVINNKLPRKNASPTLGFVLIWLSTISAKFWQSLCHYLFMTGAPGTCSAHSESPLCTY